MKVSLLTQLGDSSSPKTTATAGSGRDKLAQTKLREKELKELRKMELQAAKEAKEASRAQQSRMLKEERMSSHDTRRARTDRRRADAAAERRERRSHEERCEHGFAHCKLCHLRG